MSSKTDKTTNVTTAKKKWYEDDDLTVTEKDEQFSQGNIGGNEFDAIKVKIQETYEIGILKLFIETEILKSGSNTFEPSFKEMYNPRMMTKPFQIGKDLLFTSDVEFSEAGFLPGSLQDDRRKYFLNRLEFNNYLLRLPKPISDIETPIKEKTDSNAYKYLQILGNEEQNRIITLCDKFGENYVNKERENSNAIIKIKKELSDIKLLEVGATLTQDAKMKLEDDKQKELKKEEDKKTKLETKKKNYKAACKILSNAIRRAQYDVTLDESRAETIKDAASLSTTIIDWMKYKQHSPDYFRDVLTIFKPVISKQLQTDKQNIGGKIQEVITTFTSLFQPVFVYYFYETLTNFMRVMMPPTIEPVDQRFLNDVIVPANRTNDPVKYSWRNINSTLERVSKLSFGFGLMNAVSKDTADKLYFISNFILSFQSELLQVFTYNKKYGGIHDIFEEITASESGVKVNMLYHNIVYLRVMLDKIIEAIQREYYQAAPPPPPPPPVRGLEAALQALGFPDQQVPRFLVNLNALRQLVESLQALVRDFRVVVEQNRYKTILGEESHATFVENIFSDKVAPISHVNRNNKFLVVSEFITDMYDNQPVEITIPDDYYDLTTLGNTIEKELCDKCKWKVDAANNIPVRETIWSCMYDENKKMQLKLYFPENELMNDANIIPNIHNEYPIGFIRQGLPNVVTPENNSFQIRGPNIAGGNKTLTIPQGEYRDIQQLLNAMENTINEFIGKKSTYLDIAYKTKIAISLDAATGRVKFVFKSDNAFNLRAAEHEEALALQNYNAAGLAGNRLTIAQTKYVLTKKSAMVTYWRMKTNSENEEILIEFNNDELSLILGVVNVRGGGVVQYLFHSAGILTPLMAPVAPPPDDNHIVQFPYNFPALSKSVTIETRMQISGDVYDASDIFGVPSSIASEGKIIITPEITIRELELEKDENGTNKLKVNEILDDYLGFSQVVGILPQPKLKRISDYGVLNFTGGTGFRVTVYNPAAPLAPQPATTTLEPVDLSKIASKVKSESEKINSTKLKTEIMEKTGLYINNSILKAEVPVITYTDILNSLFYRYPCIPSPEMKDMEGPAHDKAFDKFIEERVNVSKFKDVVWLGKGKDDASETLLLTIRKALDKTLMYDDCDEERSKLICDLHYAICGPVYSNTALKEQNNYGEIDELELFHQFQLEIRRPNIVTYPGVANPLPPKPIVQPFTVKGITPYYDAINKRYKYLIYGHYLDVPNRITVGCVKYYDPGIKIAPENTAMQLYDILRFTLAAGGATTVKSVVEMNHNLINQSFVYPVFQIAGIFDRIHHLSGSGIQYNQKDQVNNVVWTPGKMGNGLPFVDIRDLYSATATPEIRRINANPNDESNSFEIFWRNLSVAGVVVPPSTENKIGILDTLNNLFFNDIGIGNGEIMFILNIYNNTCPKCIITKYLANDDSRIYLPYIDNRGASQINEILQTAPLCQISCGAVSINKDLYNITKEIHFYQREYLVEYTSILDLTGRSARLINIKRKIDELTSRIDQGTGLERVNTSIRNNMLWIGLKRKCVDAAGLVQRKILSCSIIDHINAPARPVVTPLDFPVTFEDNDFIEKIKVDINDPEIVTVFGRFTATIRDIANGKVKTIHNVMVIYTNLGNVNNSNRNYGRRTASGGQLAYSLGYDNFKPITINGLLEFQRYYSCLDGLVVASNHGGGTVIQNMGTLLVKKNQATSPVLIGFHDHKITEVTIDEQHNGAGDIWSSVLCYDYNMCADIIQTTNPANPTTVIDKGLFNPLSFNAFKTTLKNVDVAVNPVGPTARSTRPNYVYTTSEQRITEIFNGEFVLVATKQSTPSNALSKLHVLNTWGVDLSNIYTPFYKRIFKNEEESVFDLKIYEKYINKVVDTILGSAKKYYKDKIKKSLYDEEEYGTITNSNSPLSNIRFRKQGARNVVVTGGGRREDAAAMIVAKNVELEEIKKLRRFKSNEELQKGKSIIEIRVPDIMMSDAYLAKLTTINKTKARKTFFDALYKYSRKLAEIAKQENADDLKTIGGQGGVILEDVYKVVLCSMKLTEFKFDEMYKDAVAEEDNQDDDIESFFDVSKELYDYDSNDVTDGIKNVILVNEWNDRGFIGDYGAFAAASSITNSLTLNQMMVSKTVRVNRGMGPNQNVEYIPKVPNSAFLMNPFITYGTFDISKWCGFDSMFDENKGGRNETRVQVGGLPPEDDVFRNLQMDLIRRRQQQQAQYDYQYGRRGQGQGQGRFDYDDMFRRQRYMEDYDDDGAILKLYRRAFEKTNISSTQLKEVSVQTMRTDTNLKRVVLWLCDFREGKMLMVKTHIGKKVILSLPSQEQFAGGNKVSGYTLFQQLCKRFFKTDAIIRKWTPEFVYTHTSSGTGIFIYSAKSSELPKETTDTVFVEMKAIFNVVTEVKGQQSQVSVSNTDKSMIEEIFKVVALIQGGLISSTSKEFNDILARLRSRTVPPHLRSVISESKRKSNVESNVNFLIKLFFSPNNLFFVRGNSPYYIYSTQRNCKIYTIVKQDGYDDDSYLTCLKLFLQTEADFKRRDKDKINNLRVGCAMKKKLITDNFSAVWDNFWGDLIESEEQGKYDEQLAIDVEGKEGQAAASEKDKEGNKEGKEDKDESSSATICLELAKQDGQIMYALPGDWSVSEYFPIKYNNVYYNILANEKYRFNNEYFYDLDTRQFIPHRRAGPIGSYLGFKCMAYHENGNNPVLYLGGMGGFANPQVRGTVYKLELNTHKLTKFIETNVRGNVSCMDILDIGEGEPGYMLVGGAFDEIRTFRYDERTNDVVAVQAAVVNTTLSAAMINLETYEVIQLHTNDAAFLNPYRNAANPNVQRICICKKKKIVKAKSPEHAEVEGYVAVIGGRFEFNVSNDNNPPGGRSREYIKNIGCVLIRKNPNTQNFEARLVAIDTKIGLSGGTRSKIFHSTDDNFNCRSIVCEENEDKSETVFFVGGRFDRYNAIDYVAYNTAKAGLRGARPPVVPVNETCNGIIKLTLKIEYDDVNPPSNEYHQVSVIEPIRVNSGGNVDEIIFASLQYGIINSKKYLFCLTGFHNAVPDNVYTRLNVFDLESKMNILQTPDILEQRNLVVPARYLNQTLVLTENDSDGGDGNNVNNVLIMSITTGQDLTTPPYSNYTFTCNVSNITGAMIEVAQAASNGNANISRDNIIYDMFYKKDTGEVYIAHQNVEVRVNRTTDYPLTIRSNYQKIGEWKLDSKTKKDATDEFDIFEDFIDKVIEMRTVFKLNPSMVLFLQDVDYRDYNEIGSKITKTALDKMKDDLIRDARVRGVTATHRANGNVPNDVSGFGWFTDRNVNANPINMDSTCNDIDKKIKNIMEFVYALFNPVNLIDPAPAIAIGPNTTDAIASKMYNFINDLLFMAVYTRCKKLSELICNNYVSLVTTPPPPNVPNVRYSQLDRTTWRRRLIAVLDEVQNQEIKTFIEKIGEKMKKYKEKTRITPDISHDFKICSDPETHTGVGYLVYNYNQNLNCLITLKSQENIKNKIYEYGKDDFFSESSNRQFYEDYVKDSVGSSMEQISFCSFYKFDRKTTGGVDFNSIGNADSETVYVSVDMNEKDINSSKVFEFLETIKGYFKSLRGGPAIVDTNISGPIRRLIIGGNFGCNLLHDVEVCRKFKSKQMKIHTRRENKDAMDNSEEGAANHIYLIDVDLEQVQAGGGNVDNNNNNNNHRKRICIGERIGNEECNYRVLSNKRKTRRKVPLMLSSS
jgi:hypothetical protein